ncbi:MAG TPA: DUF4349 domain-containing protein [Candidatus Binatus sp.]|nr:DUF4349 domain-containing protein [Candidatus Binatus sp.]
MSTLADSHIEMKKPWLWLAVGGAILLVWGAIAFPTMRGSRTPDLKQKMGASTDLYSYEAAMSNPVAVAQRSEGKARAVAEPLAAPAAPLAGADRKIIRTSSLELVVQRPEEVAEKITALAESMGGYLVSSEGGGQNATSGTLTIRVPSAQFEAARAEIRKLGLRVESEKIEAQDVTRQYVDQDASIRNLRAEEAQYLSILKQAGTMKDMLLVTEKLSEVRGQIEQQQAEFNALSRQIETVALSVSLRTEPQAQTFGLNWRPGYQLELALHDGLESVANYSTAMIGILFYLPATVLWVGTIVAVMVVGWRMSRWVGRRWFGWKEVAAQ